MALNIVHVVLGAVFLTLILQADKVFAMECGTVNFVRPAVLGGSGTIKGEWPFIVAIEKNSNYMCGGTIISNRHILTAAHCIQKKNSETELSSDGIVVRLGAYNLTDTNEKGVIERNVCEIFIHDDWKDQAFETSFDADIAILVLSENITFTQDIQPVCMPTNGAFENMAGSVVGYSLRESLMYAQVPRKIVVKAINSTHCFREEDVFASYSSNRTFCGGNGDGSPDLGDSGGGYFFTTGFSWAQYGIVAVIHTNATGHVSPHAFHVYTNVSMFKDWIIETVNKTGGTVGEARISITMNCDYNNAESLDPDRSAVYSCGLYNIDIQGSNFETGSFSGSHMHDKTQQDVQEIHFVNGTMSYIPSGFGLFFENIKHLIVGELTPNHMSLGTKVVRRFDLQNLRKLEIVRFLRNNIETLHEDALWDLPQLAVMEFSENQLKVLLNETFSRNRMLLSVNFRSNQIDFLPASLFRNNRRLMLVDFQNNFLKVIDEKVFETNWRLRTVVLNSNLLEMLPKRLFQNNVLLRRVLFEGNALSSIDEDLFEANMKLTSTYFKSNRLESLPSTLFRNNLRLRVVDFRNNSLTTIDDNLFRKNEKLVAVLFAFNRLESLQKNVFKSNLLLETLDLKFNRLTSIDIDFAVFEEMKRIDLFFNDCMSAAYDKESLSSVRAYLTFGNLEEFQILVTEMCSTGDQRFSFYNFT